MLKKPITKKDIRNELDKQMSDFLNQGGAVKAINPGISGREPSFKAIRADQTAFQEPKAERTYLPEVIAALDERKKTKPDPNAVKRPRKKVIYDDFGEPIRWIWVE